MRLPRLLLALTAGALLLAGCGGGSGSDEPEKGPWLFQTLHLVLDGEPNPETAGVLMAHELGYFEDLGLGLTITSPLDPTRPIKYVAGGSVDVAITHQPQLVLAREKGAPVVAVGSLVPRPTMAMIWLRKSGVDGLANLKGKTVAIPGAPFQEAFLRPVLARAGLTLSDVKVERADDELVPDLVSRRVDAIFGGSVNVEGAELESRGLKPVIVPASELGIPPYDELVVIARSDRVAKEPELFRRLMAAVRRGTTAALEDPEVATEAIAEAGVREGGRKPTRAGVEATLPLLSRSGEIDTEQATGLIAWMHDEGMIERKPPASALTEP